MDTGASSTPKTGAVGHADGTAAPFSRKYVAFLAMRLAEGRAQLEEQHLRLTSPRYRVADAIASTFDKIPGLRAVVAAATRFCATRLASGR